MKTTAIEIARHLSSEALAKEEAGLLGTGRERINEV